MRKSKIMSNSKISDVKGEVKRGRGRPPKSAQSSTTAISNKINKISDDFKDDTSTPRKRGRPPKNLVESPRGRGRPPKEAIKVSRGRGRPPKEDSSTVVKRGRGRPPKITVEEVMNETPRGRGRPRKTEVVVKRGRGRPPKNIVDNVLTGARRGRGRPRKDATVITGRPANEFPDVPVKRGRGRPRKNQTDNYIQRETIPNRVEAYVNEKIAQREAALPQAAMKVLKGKKKHTPAVFKLPSKKQTPIVFSLEDVKHVIDTRKKEKSIQEAQVIAEKQIIKAKELEKIKEIEQKEKILQEFKAASIADILGYNPKTEKQSGGDDINKVPNKFLKYYKNLVQLRDHVRSGLDLHTQDTLKRSNKIDSTVQSSNVEPLTDVGEDNFDRDFALSLVSNDQELLVEIDEAIKRIYNNTYGVCEITGKLINRERLEAVPFTRYSVEGQREQETGNFRKVDRSAAFLDVSPEDSVQFSSDDSED